MARYVDIDQLVDIDRFDYNVEPCVETVPIHRLINFYVCDPSTVEIADVREVIEADGYTHLICPYCLSEFYAKTKAEMFCPSCGKKIFFSEKWESYENNKRHLE